MWGIPWSAEDPKGEYGVLNGVHPDGGRYRGFRLVASSIELRLTTPDREE